MPCWHDSTAEEPVKLALDFSTFWRECRFHDFTNDFGTPHGGDELIIEIDGKDKFIDAFLAEMKEFIGYHLVEFKHDG